MTRVSNPKVNVTKASAEQVISNAPQRVLLVGQQTGSVYTTGSLVENIGNANVEINNFGKGSHVSEMIRAFKTLNETTQLDVIPLDDAGTGTAAAGSVVFSGTASENGVYTVSTGSRVNHIYEINVTSGDTATDIGDALVAAIAADDYNIVTGVNTTGSVALTAVNAGTIGNGIGLEIVGTVAGVTVTLNAMTGGATDPTTTGIFDVVGDQRYQTIIYPGAYDESDVTDFLDPRFNSENDILDGVGIISKTDTLVNINAFTASLNSQSLCVHANTTVDETYYKGSSLFELDDVISASFGAVRSLRLTDGSNLSNFVIANNRDLFGGTHIASLPYFNTSFSNLPLIDIGKGWSNTDLESINDNGGFVLGNNKARTSIIADTVVTTYKTDAASNVDLTFKFLNSVDVLSNIAEFFYNNIRSDFAQSRLTDGAVIPGYNMANVDTIKSQFIDYYVTLSGENFLLTRAGRDNLKYFSDNLDFSLDLLEGSVTSIAKVPLVVQLRDLTVTLQAVFNI